jgi:hypothetical protein
MPKFEPGTVVKRKDTGEQGTVQREFVDGSVFLELQDGRPAELHARALEKVEPEPSR